MTLGLIALAIGFTAPERERAYAQRGDADTHGRDATPDYGRVFIQDQVSRLDLKIAASDWQIVIDDMTDMAGAAGGQLEGGSNLAAGSRPGFPGGGQPPGGFPGGGTATDGHARPGFHAGRDRGLHESSRRECVRVWHAADERAMRADRGRRGARVRCARWAGGAILPAAAARIRTR